MTSRPSTAAPILAVLAVVLVTLGAYVGANLGMGIRVEHAVGSPENNRLEKIERLYPNHWAGTVFRPAAMVEGLWFGVPVEISYRPQSFF